MYTVVRAILLSSRSCERSKLNQGCWLYACELDDFTFIMVLLSKHLAAEGR